MWHLKQFRRPHIVNWLHIIISLLVSTSALVIVHNIHIDYQLLTELNSNIYFRVFIRNLFNVCFSFSVFYFRGWHLRPEQIAVLVRHSLNASHRKISNQIKRSVRPNKMWLYYSMWSVHVIFKTKTDFQLIQFSFGCFKQRIETHTHTI